MVIKRDRYLEKLISKQNNGMIKVITGLRRCGKSFLLFELYRDYLISSGVPENNILCIPLDDVDYEEYCDPHKLHTYIKEQVNDPEQQYYVFIDEAQYAISKEEMKNPDVPIRLYGVLNSLLRKRNVALAAAYMTVDKSFKDYRGRVAERFGTDAEREIRYNIKAKDIEETVVDEKGKEKTVKTTVETVEDPNQISAWSRIWQEGNPGWTKDAQHNKYFLTQIQNQANDMLRNRGHLFLNEVYDMLGYPRIKEGNIIGWIYDEKNPVGDNFVDFGIYPLNGTIDQAKINFINGDERSILLDFNVDGPILDLI